MLIGRILTRLPCHAPDYGHVAARSIASAPTVNRRARSLRQSAQLLASRIAGPPAAKGPEGGTERLRSGEAALCDALDDQRNRGGNAKHWVNSMLARPPYSVKATPLSVLPSSPAAIAGTSTAAGFGAWQPFFSGSPKLPSTPLQRTRSETETVPKAIF